MTSAHSSSSHPVSNRYLLLVVLFVALVIGASIYTAFTQPGPLPPIREDLIATWAFHSNLGATAKDSLGHHEGLIHNPTWVTGKGYLALKFDGKSTYIEIPSDEQSQGVSLKESFTIAAWVNLQSYQRQVLFQETDPAGDLRHAPFTFYVPWGEGRLGLVLSDGDRRVGFLSDDKIRRNRWCHVAITFNNETGEICFYIDGEQAGERSTTVHPHNAVSPDQGDQTGQDTNSRSSSVLLGAARSGSEEMFYYQGELDSVSLYKRVLTPQEVKALVQEAS